MDKKDYNLKELVGLKYIKVIYTDSENRLCEIKTEVKFFSEFLISVFFECDRPFDIPCPQPVVIKFVTDGGMYVSKTALTEIKRVSKVIYFSITPPSKMFKHQKRKYYRVNVERACVLVTTDSAGANTCFMSKTVDISVGGVLLSGLESVNNNSSVVLNPDDVEYYNIILFLDVENVINFSARFIRKIPLEKSYRYAFEFVNTPPSDIDIMNKFVAKEQLEQLKSQCKLK